MPDAPGPIAALDVTPQGKLLNTICNRFIALSLDEIGANVWIRDPPTLKGIPLPAVIISELQPSHSPNDGPMNSPDVTFRFAACLIRSSGATVNDSLPVRQLWYHLSFKEFAKTTRTTALPDGVQLMAINVEPGDPAMIEIWKLGGNASWMLINCWTRYPRAT